MPDPVDSHCMSGLMATGIPDDYGVQMLVKIRGKEVSYDSLAFVTIRKAYDRTVHNIGKIGLWSSFFSSFLSALVSFLSAFNGFVAPTTEMILSTMTAGIVL